MIRFTKLLATCTFALLSLGSGSSAHAEKLECNQHTRQDSEFKGVNVFTSRWFNESYDKPINCFSVDSLGRKHRVLVQYDGAGIPWNRFVDRWFSINCPWQDKISGSIRGMDVKVAAFFGVQGGVFASRNNGFCFVTGADMGALGVSVLDAKFRFLRDREPQ